MSNSVADVYAPCPGEDGPRHGRERQVDDAIHARISPRNEVLRLLPTRDRRMVGAWGFAVIYGPRAIGPDGSTHAGEAMHVAPHPHTGLQTESWLVAGRGDPPRLATRSDPRFGEVTLYPTDERLAAPPLPNVRLRPRGRHGSTQ